ncbi:cupin domain-containing protein [Moraxella oblonga]|uniref:cupin domain-containing protein n=1 Tax=Moraxella oblonga TaxID=200413 RepID=UPI00082CABBA|nr:AraC family transcriptional regulator [Moraxella oblonga]
MDILDKLIALAQITGGVTVNCQLQGDWQLINAPKTNQAVAHIVHKGRAFVVADELGKELSLQEGDIVFFPRMITHTLSDDTTKNTAQTYPTPTLNYDVFTRLTVGEGMMGTKACDLFCLHFGYDSGAELINSLPPMLILHTAGTPLQSMIELLKAEALQTKMGSASVVNALTTMIFTLILRTFLEQEQGKQGGGVLGILKGLGEPRLHALLGKIIQNPEQEWSVEAMANLAHLSRSQLIRLFNQHLGVSPHAFVHKLRLQKSAMLLRQSNDSVLSVALSSGFLSETHFSKAFKKLYGTSPSQYRLMG